MQQQSVKASFFFTGNFYRNSSFADIVLQLKKDGHYLGAHSDQHLLYCDWSKRDSLLVTKEIFTKDLLQNYAEMERFGIMKGDAHFFLPPYEWYNDTIAAWTNEAGLRLINFSPGTLSHADYTTPADRNYRSSATIYNSISGYASRSSSGLNGFMLLMHIGTDAKRTDKFYLRLPELIKWLKSEGYSLVTVKELLEQ